MANPKFKVGETVILQSSTHPHFNGVYVVEELIPPDGKINCRITGDIHINDSGGCVYLLNKSFVIEKGKSEGIVEEHELKKYYPPADDSFDGMMDKFKKGEMVVKENLC